MRDGVTAVEVKRRWADRYHRWLQSQMREHRLGGQQQLLQVGAGKIVTQWPYSPFVYWR